MRIVQGQNYQWFGIELLSKLAKRTKSLQPIVSTVPYSKETSIIWAGLSTGGPGWRSPPPPPHPSSEIIGRQAHGIDCLTLTAVSQPTGGKGYHPFTLPHPSHYTTLDSQNISLSTLYFLNLILSNLNSLSKPELGTRQCPRVNCWLLSVSLHQQVIFFYWVKLSFYFNGVLTYFILSLHFFVKWSVGWSVEMNSICPLNHRC